MTAPNAPILNSPIAGTVIDLLSVHRFSWTFSDPDPGDTQSAFDLRYRVIAAGSWTDLSATTVNTYVDIVGSAFTANNFEWQVRTYDALGAVGSYSASSFFTAASTPATPTITAPADGATVTNNQNVTWSAPSQTAYQLRRIGDSSGLPDTGTIYSDTGEVTDAVARALSVDFPVNNRFEHVQVRVKNAGLWSAWASARVSVSFTSPSPATFTVTADNATASILVTITNPVSVPAAASNAVYVREASDTGYGQRMANGLLPNTAWTWRTPASGVEYEFRVLTTGATGTTIWSVLMITLIYDGGTPTTVYDLILDGGTPTTVYDRIIDGGIP